MTTLPEAKSRPPFEVLPGIAIGPFRLGMTSDEVEEICREYGLKNEGVLRSGVGIEFHDGHATRIGVEWVVGLSLAGEPLTDNSDGNVRRLLAKIAPPGPDWTECEGLAIFHYELSDDFVFSFLVYAPGHRR
jgi:hypothetical protein